MKSGKDSNSIRNRSEVASIKFNTFRKAFRKPIRKAIRKAQAAREYWRPGESEMMKAV